VFFLVPADPLAVVLKRKYRNKQFPKGSHRREILIFGQDIES
jgi:hypothetical protein